MSYIFISYSRADKACAYKIQRQFEAQGFKIWIDKNDIPVGAPFPIEILKAIREAAAVLILWSGSAAKSHYVGKEIEEALNQKMSRSMRVIPVWLDDEPLHPELTALNAIRLPDCSDSGIDGLIRKLADLRFRRIFPFDETKTQAELGAIPLAGVANLVTLAIMESVYCKARIIAASDSSLTTIRSHVHPTVQMLLEFLGSVGSPAAIQKIYESHCTTQPNTPFFLFHFTGHEMGQNYALIDDPDNSPHGDWLDPVNAIDEVMNQIVGRGRARIQLYNAIPASLNFAVGARFYNFWRVQMFHLPRGAVNYQLVLDTNDL